MSLSHPDSVVTEQRLSEFYQGILPYLGGNDGTHRSFPVVVDEGGGEYQAGWYYNSQGLKKPLYQKTWTFTTPLICTAAAWTNTTVSYVGIEKIIGVEVTDSADTSCWDGFGATIDSDGNPNNVIRLYNTRTTALLSIKCMTLKYTKTTDTYISPDVEYPVKYSTSEQVIGQWIDGKPLYQKSFTGLWSLTGNQWSSALVNISNGKLLVKAEAINTDTSLNGIHSLRETYIDSHGDVFTISESTRDIQVFTFVYTKTTD